MPLISANGVELFYDLTGPEGAPVVAFSNSIGTTAEMWDAQVRALSGRYRCLRYDTSGHGRSPATRGEAGVETLADDLAGLLDGLGIERLHLVGLSLGGMTAQAFAAKYPDRLRSLTLMATAAHLPPAEAWETRARTVEAEGMAAIVDAVMPRWFTPGYQDSPQARATRERFVANDAHGYAVCCRAIRDMDLRPGLSRITAPTLIIAGADDPATPVAMMEEIRAGIADAELVVVSRAAHLLAVERAEVVNRHLTAFLDGHEASSGEAASAQPQGGGVSFEAGLANRKAVLGIDHVQRSLDKAGAFASPWQDFITRMAWGEVWGDPTIPWKTRSFITLAMMVALHREEEFKLHVRPALRNGVTLDEFRSLLIQTAIYGGVPAANGAFRWVKEVLGAELDPPRS